MKTIVLLANEIDSLNYTVDSKIVDTAVIYPNVSKVLRGVRRFYHMLGIPRFNIFWSFTKNDIKSRDCIIIFECMYPIDIIKYIRRYNKKCRIIYWFWGSIVDKKNTPLYPSQKYTQELLEKKDLYHYELWSFDRNDCDMYALQYNNQMGVKFDIYDDGNITTDVFFMGYDKKRLVEINKLASLFEKLDINFDFRVLPSNRIKYKKNEKYLWLQGELNYFDMVKAECRSKCILELVQPGQGDITWRALEAIFYKKKLITNCQNIINYDFYCSENVFILGVDDMSRLKEFLENPYQEKNADISRYLFSGWIKNFYKKKI